MSKFPLSPDRKARGIWWDVNYEVLNGCSPISPACKNCFAQVYVNRFKDVNPHFEGLIKNGEWTGRVNLRRDKLDVPLNTKEPTVFFVTERGDLFHKDVPFAFIREVFARMPTRHTFIILTKRPKRLKQYIDSYTLLNVTEPPPNVYFGVTAENQEQADKRIPILLEIPAAVRFVSVEPMIGTIDLSPYIGYNPVYETKKDSEGREQGISWCIVGSESGPGARETKTEWVRYLRDQCKAANVPFFLKQLKINGKLVKMPVLDGVTHDAVPRVGG